MNIQKTAIPDVLIIEPKVFTEEHGFFMETFHAHKFPEHGLPQQFVQDNHSGSKRGTLRGLHYQIRPWLEQDERQAGEPDIFSGMGSPACTPRH